MDTFDLVGDEAISDRDRELMARIWRDDARMAGKPCVRGTRIPVDLVLTLLSHGWTFDRILEDYDHLERDDISACLSYAARFVAERTSIVRRNSDPAFLGEAAE